MFEKFSRHILLLSLIVFSLIAAAVPALADVTWPTSFSDTENKEGHIPYFLTL